jgi:hypothetical protein
MRLQVCLQRLAHTLLLTSQVVKTILLDLIQTLQVQPVARILPSRIAGRSLPGDLAILYGRLDSEELDPTLAITLLDVLEHFAQESFGKKRMNPIPTGEGPATE